jgi:response regulator RpfG family c-di-GMP phosphodiesterase
MMSPAENPFSEYQPAMEPTVLIVEDEVLSRMAMSDHLRECGFHVIEAASGVEAQQLILAGLKVDLVFSDITMPGGVDGIDLALWLMVHCESAKVILTSGLPDSLVKAQAACNRVLEFVPKPYDQADVAKRIRELLDA